MVRIGSFNVLNLGQNTSYNKIGKIVDIVRHARLDIVAFQEVKSEEPIKRMAQMLGPRWTYAFELSQMGQYQDGFAYIWDSIIFQLPVAKTQEGNLREFRPRILRQYCCFGGKKLVRNPYYARFIPTKLSGEPFYELRLINVHLRFSDKRMNDADDSEEISTTELRRKEYVILAQGLYPKYEDKIYGITDIDEYKDEAETEYPTSNRPSYTILLGDYNLNLHKDGNPSPYLLGTPEIYGEYFDIGDKHIQTFQPEKTTISITKDETGKERFRYSNNYDHATYNTNRFNNRALVTCHKVDAVEGVFAGDGVAYRKSVSDHLPIHVDFQIQK